MKQGIRALLLVSLTILSGGTFAGGFQLYELGTPIVGTAGVGQAAVAEDASTSYFNPAGMAALTDSEFLLGGQTVLSQIHFQPNNANTFSGGSGGSAGALLPGLGIFGVFNYDDNIKLGFSIASPFAGVVTYNDGWVGRYFVQSAALGTLDANVAAAYAINDCFALGAGLFLEYAALNERIATFPVINNTDGQADLRLHSFRPGFMLGVLITPCESTKIGINYRSSVHHRPKGRITFLRLNDTPKATSRLNLPQSVIASLSQAFTPDFIFLSELGWSQWSSFQNTSIMLEGVTLPIPRHWKDTYRFGMGGQYQICKDYWIQAGASYDSSPCHATNRLPDLPVDRQIRLGAGLVYTTLDCVNLGLQYEYINFGKADINNVTRVGTLSGDYPKNFANVFSLSVNVRF